MTAGARVAAMLSPVLFVIVGLFGLGFATVFVQSLGVGVPGAAASPTAGPTLQHYGDLARSPEFYRSLGLTVWVATIATTVAVVGGVALALLIDAVARGRRLAAGPLETTAGLRRWRGPRSGSNAGYHQRHFSSFAPLLYALLQVPLAVPHLAMAVVTVTLFAQSGLVARIAYALGLINEPARFPALIYDQWGAGTLLAYAAKEIPFIAVVATALLARIGADYDLVAQTLGASRWQRIRHVTLPLIAPGVGAAALMVFAYVFAAFETPFVLGRPYPAMLSVVAERQFMSLDLADRPGAMALAFVMTVLAALFVRAYQALSHATLGHDRTVLF
jgi:putative spermidine/putrescine transport system permease protein